MKARGGEEMIRSAWIAELFDTWFDCMNTTNYKYNENMKPFFSQSDERLKWLEETFLVELEQWNASISGQVCGIGVGFTGVGCFRE